jgi:hypothetical protein
VPTIYQFVASVQANSLKDGNLLVDLAVKCDSSNSVLTASWCSAFPPSRGRPHGPRQTVDLVDNDDIDRRFHDPQGANRQMRADHMSYIKRLLSTVEAIPSALLMELTTIATTYDPKVVGREALELFADAVCGSCPEELTTAEDFFGWVIKGVRRRASGRRRSASAKRAMAKWLAGSDPLRIAEDPECQYRLQEAS